MREARGRAPRSRDAPVASHGKQRDGYLEQWSKIALPPGESRARWRRRRRADERPDTRGRSAAQRLSQRPSHSAGPAASQTRPRPGSCPGTLAPVDHQLRLLVDDEVTRVGHQLYPHVVGVGLVAVEGAWGRRSGRARRTAAGWAPSRRASRQRRANRLAEGALVVAIELRDRVGARGIAKAVDVHLDLRRREWGPDVPAREDVAGDPAVLERARRPSAGRRDHPRVPAPPRLEGEPGRHARPTGGGCCRRSFAPPDRDGGFPGASPSTLPSRVRRGGRARSRARRGAPPGRRRRSRRRIRAPVPRSSRSRAGPVPAGGGRTAGRRSLAATCTSAAASRGAGGSGAALGSLEPASAT